MGPKGVFSGIGQCRNNNRDECTKSKDFGPIPVGTYKMNRDDRPGNNLFWRLEPDPKISGWKYYLGARGGFLLHPGAISLGCITADESNPDAMAQYRLIHNLLRTETGTNYLRVTP